MLLLGVSSCQEGRDTLDGYWSNSGSGVGSSSAFMSGRWDVDDTGADDDSTTVVVDNVVEAVLMGLLEVVGGEAPNSDLCPAEGPGLGAGVGQSRAPSCCG